MKTWMNPEIEELEVKETAYYKITKEVEWFNGKLDGSLVIGGNTGNENGDDNNTGNNNTGDEGNEDGFGTES